MKKYLLSVVFLLVMTGFAMAEDYDMGIHKHKQVHHHKHHHHKHHRPVHH